MSTERDSPINSVAGETGTITRERPTRPQSDITGHNVSSGTHLPILTPRHVRQHLCLTNFVISTMFFVLMYFSCSDFFFRVVQKRPLGLFSCAIVLFEFIIVFVCFFKDDQIKSYVLSVLDKTKFFF